MRSKTTFSVVLALAGALVACSGGGGSGGGATGGGGSCNSVPPLAVAFYDAPSPVPARRAVAFHGYYSYSYAGLPLTYAWTIVSRPAASTAATIVGSGSAATFTADVAGTYEVQLVVTDCRSSAPGVVSIVAEERAPVAVVPPSFAVQMPVAQVSLDGSQSYDDNGDTMTYSWTLVPPAGSAASLSVNDQATTSFVPDAEGIYTTTLTVLANGDSAASSVEVGVYHPIRTETGAAVDADYSSTLDRVVVVTNAPTNELQLIDPDTGASTSVALSWAPYAVSVSPDGLTAAVSHAGNVSMVDLSSLTVQEFATTGTDGGDLVVTGANGSVYLFPRAAYAPIQILDVGTGTVTSSRNADARYCRTSACKARLSPDGNYIYRLEGDWVAQYLVSSMTRSYIVRSSSTWAGPWLSEDASRILVGSGDLYSTSTLTSTGTLAQPGETLKIDTAAHSSASHRIIALPDSFDASGTGDLRIYDDAATPVLKETKFNPGIVVDGAAQYASPLTSFWNTSGTAYYVVLGTWNRFGIFEYAYP